VISPCRFLIGLRHFHDALPRVGVLKSVAKGLGRHCHEHLLVLRVKALVRAPFLLSLSEDDFSDVRSLLQWISQRIIVFTPFQVTAAVEVWLRLRRLGIIRCPHFRELLPRSCSLQSLAEAISWLIGLLLKRIADEWFCQLPLQ